MSDSYSDVQTYGRCPRKYYYRNVLKIQRKHKNPRLYEGTVGHRLLQAVALERPKEPFTFVEELGQKILAEDRGLEFEDELDEAAELVSKMVSIVQNYLALHPFDQEMAEILHVEEQFLMTFDNRGEAGPDEIEISFTPDIVFRDLDGFVRIRDYKFLTTIPENASFGDLQHLLYFAGVQGMYPDLKVFEFDYARKKLPTQPRLNKTKSPADGIVWVNDLKRVDTTFELLRDFLLKEAPHLLEHEAHVQRLAELRDENRFFKRSQLMVSDEAVANVLEDVGGLVRQISVSNETGEYPRVFQGSGYDECDRCEFNSICRAQLLGWDDTTVLELEYEPRDPKNAYVAEGEE